MSSDILENVAISQVICTIQIKSLDHLEGVTLKDNILMQVYYSGLTNYLPPSKGFNTWFIMLSYPVVVLVEQFVSTSMLND